MSKKISIFIFLLILFSILAFYKVKLVYDYKKDFEQISKIERKSQVKMIVDQFFNRGLFSSLEKKKVLKMHF